MTLPLGDNLSYKTERNVTMLKIGEFSKLSYLTIKALRFYEKEGLLIPQKVDQKTGYRFYKTSQLTDAAMIKSYRQLGLTIEEIKEIYRGADKKKILISKAKMLENQKKDIEACLSIINHILESDEMSYQVTVKEIPETIVYYSEVKVKKYSDMMKVIPSLKKECLELNHCRIYFHARAHRRSHCNASQVLTFRGSRFCLNDRFKQRVKVVR